MKIKELTLILFSSVLCSCMNQIDYMVKNHPKKGSQHFYMMTAWGGAHAAESSAGTRYTGNLENSFQVAAQAVLTYGISVQQAKVMLGEQLTERFKAGQITQQQFDKLSFGLQTVESNNELAAFVASIPKT